MRLGFLGRQEPVNVTAMFADGALGGRVDPIQAEECRQGRIELRLLLPEFRVPADLAAKFLSLDVDGLHFLLLEHLILHRMELIHVCGGFIRLPIGSPRASSHVRGLSNDAQDRGGQGGAL